MVRSFQLQRLRLAPVVRAACVKEGTAHAWRTRNGLVLGNDGVQGGNRRYDLADAARLTLMRFLTERLAMGAQTAAMVTNSAVQKIALLAMHEFYRIDYPEFPRRAEEPDRYWMVLDRLDGTHPPEFFLEDHLAQLNRERILEVRVQLNDLVEYARDSLVSAVGGSPIELRRRLRGEQPQTVEV
jgi:hypothetical protein